MLKENDIKDYLSQYNVPYEENSSIIGVIMPSKAEYFFGSTISVALSLNYHVLHFNKNGIIIIPMDNITGKLIKDVYLFISYNKMDELNLKKKMTHYDLCIFREENDLKYRVNKVMIGASWHKKNLPGILNKFCK